jgi:hypothetical protein
MDFGLAFQARSASAGIESSIFRVDTSSRSYSAINSFCMSIGYLQNLVPDKHTKVFPNRRGRHELLRSVEAAGGTRTVKGQRYLLKRFHQFHLLVVTLVMGMLSNAVTLFPETLYKDGIDRFAFCDADSNLQPWDKLGARKEPLASLYGQAAIWVYQDFLLEKPEMPEDWPPASTLPH